MVDYKGETVVGSLDKLSINQTEMTMKMDSGHFWLLLPTGKHTLSVGEVTKLVKVMPGELTIVKFEVEKKGMPWMVVFSIMATGLGMSFLVMSICRLVEKMHLTMMTIFFAGDAVRLVTKVPRLAFRN